MMSFKLLAFAVLTLGLIAPSHQHRGVTSRCRGKDCIIYEIVQQADCVQVNNKRPTRDRRWHVNMSPRTDELILGGKIIAYKIRWFNGRWSGWYVPGQNDLDNKFNTIVYPTRPAVPTKKNSLRRRWSYFTDHTHMYIICKY